MPEPEQAGLWILVTDGHRARIVVPDAPQGRFRTRLRLGVCAYPYCPPPLRSEIVHRHFGQFAADVAERLNHAATEGDFDALVVVAPSDVTHEIRPLLAQQTQARLTATLDRDYAALDDAALSPHLAHWWMPPGDAVSVSNACVPGSMAE
jgi:hypothetical protein